MELVRAPWKTFDHLSLVNNVHLFAISFFLVWLTSSSLWYLIVLIPVSIYLNKKYILGGIIVFLIGSFFNAPRILPDSCTVIISSEQSICVNGAKVMIDKEFPVGSVIYLVGDVYEPFPVRTFTSFDYSKYLKGQNIDYRIKDTGSYVIDSKLTIYNMRSLFEDYFETFDEEVRVYLYALILGNDSYFSDEVASNIDTLGISHLFAISGLHVGILVASLEMLLREFKYKSQLIIIFLLSFMLITGFAPSIMRAGLSFIIYKLISKYGFTALDSLSIVFIVMVIYNIDYLYNIGFQLSFLVSFSFLLSQDYFKGSLIKQLFMLSLVAQLSTLPIVVTFNYSFNITSLGFNVFYVYLMSIFFLPLLFINVLVRELQPLTRELITFFEQTMDVLSNYAINIDIPHFHPLMVIIYYVALYYLVNGKYYLPLVIYLQINILFIRESELYFFDVGHGSSMLYINQEDNCNIIVDTGGGYTTSLMEREVHPFLKSIGIFKVNYLLLTHGDMDHVAGTTYLLENNLLDYLVVSKYHDNDNIDTFMSLAVKSGIEVIEVGKGDVVCGMKVLDPLKTYDEDNNQSIVLEIDKNKRFVFLGDSELLNSYGKTDYLLLGHHGSKTSLSEEMVLRMNPSKVIVSVGNSYSLPSSEVLEMVEGKEVLMTKDMQTIYYSFEGDFFLSTNEFFNNYYKPMWYNFDGGILMGQVYLLLGDRYRVERKAKEIIKSVGVDEFNVISYDIDEVELSDAITDAQTIPFMSDEKVVVIKNEDFRDTDKLYEDFLYLVDAIPNFLTLIITPNKEMDKRSKIYKRLSKVGEVIEYSSLEADKLKNAIVNYLDQRELRYDNRAILELITRTEGNTQLVMNELEKIDNYYNKGDHIYLEDIEDLVVRNTENDVFQLVNAVVDRDINKAMTKCNDLLLSEDPMRLLGLISRKVREINYAKSLITKGYSDEDLMKFFRASKGRVYYIKKNANQVTLEYVAEQMDRLADLEMKIKKGLLDKRVALELYLLNI